MATIRKESSTLNVELLDSAGNSSTFRLNNPRSNVTKAEVETAFGKFFTATAGENLLMNQYDDVYTAVATVKTVETVTTTTDL